ncbi:MAG TPA: hypothetical protein PK228_16995, partial [Saprospiraceae bacterium]|nr:hypothetical protein [Saprospiraceae bacterium]
GEISERQEDAGLQPRIARAVQVATVEVVLKNRGWLIILFICLYGDLVIPLRPQNQGYYQINKSPYKQITTLL